MAGIPGRDGKSWPRCWGPRLWWLGLLTGIAAAYFVLRDFSMNYWVFIFSLFAFAAAGATGGRFAGAWIDRNHRTRRGLLRQEIRACKTIRKWLRGTLRRHGDEIEAAVVLKKLEGGIVRLGELIQSEVPDLDELADERRKLEQFAEEHLTGFKKSAVREYVESIGVAILIALVLRAFVIEAFQIPSGSMIPSLRIGDHLFVNKLSYGVRIPLLPLKIGSLRIRAVSWNWSMPEPGDVIVFITPENEEEDYIKRVIAVGGDTVEVRDGKVYVNSEPYDLQDGGEFKYSKLDEDGVREGPVIETRRFAENIHGLFHPILRKSCVNDGGCRLVNSRGCDFETKLCIQDDFGPYEVPERHVFVMGDNRDNSQDSRVWKSVPIEFVKGRAIFIWWSYREDLVQWNRMFTKIK